MKLDSYSHPLELSGEEDLELMGWWAQIVGAVGKVGKNVTQGIIGSAKDKHKNAKLAELMKNQVPDVENPPNPMKTFLLPAALITGIFLLTKKKGS